MGALQIGAASDLDPCLALYSLLALCSIVLILHCIEMVIVKMRMISRRFHLKVHAGIITREGAIPAVTTGVLPCEIDWRAGTAQLAPKCFLNLRTKFILIGKTFCIQIQIILSPADEERRHRERLQMERQVDT